MGNYNSTTGCGASAYSRLPSSHYSPDDDHSLRDPLLRNITQVTYRFNQFFFSFYLPLDLLNMFIWVLNLQYIITLLVDYGMQKVEEQHQQLLHHIYEATRVKETVKSATTSSSSFNPNPPPSKPMQVINIQVFNFIS